MTVDEPCIEHRPVDLIDAETGNAIGWTCGRCGFGMVNVAVLAGRTSAGLIRIPIEPIPSRSIPGEVEQEARGELTQRDS